MLKSAVLESLSQSRSSTQHTPSFDVSLLDGARALASLPGELQPAPWQQAVLAKLGLAGPGASVEVSLGRGARLVDPRLLAATRVLCATDAAETRARTYGFDMVTAFLCWSENTSLCLCISSHASM